MVARAALNCPPRYCRPTVTVWSERAAIIVESLKDSQPYLASIPSVPGEVRLTGTAVQPAQRVQPQSSVGDPRCDDDYRRGSAMADSRPQQIAGAHME
jgi:hypothetical protein